MNILLIRHGAASSNALGRYLGRSDEPLSEDGAEEIRTFVQTGRYPYAPLLISSPMQRCLQTARLIYGREPDIIVNGFREIDFGRFEGKTYKDLDGDEAYQSFIDSGGGLPFPGGESREEFLERCAQGMEELCTGLQLMRQEDRLPKLAAAVVHGGTIMALLSTLGGGDYYDYQCRNGEGYRCELSITGVRRLSNIRKLGER